MVGVPPSGAPELSARTLAIWLPAAIGRYHGLRHGSASHNLVRDLLALLPLRGGAGHLLATGLASVSFHSSTVRATFLMEAQMRAVIMLFIGGVALAALSAQAAPLAPRPLGPAIYLANQEWAPLPNGPA